MHDARAVAAVMADARAQLAQGVTQQALDAVGRRLAEAGRQIDLLAASEMRSMHGGDSSFTVLQTDPDGLTLVLGRFSAQEETPVHDHGSWGVACVVQGVDRYRHWEIAGSDGLRLLYEKELRPGSFATWFNPPGDVHSQQGVGEAALELVLFGQNVMTMPRHYYDVKTGEFTTALPQ
jgi:predicted metal-dependent enzyme (double-stranded beta helix superfamily)